MDQLACLGCGKVYDSQRRLSAHETLSASLIGALKEAAKSRREKSIIESLSMETRTEMRFYQTPPKTLATWMLEIGTLRMITLLDLCNDPLRNLHHYLSPVKLPSVQIALGVLSACPNDMLTSFLAKTYLT
ncbi:hypothetical protein EDD22DRAFT_843541 [Suillus occidentalis]|nr:hypothetical protein EDD22DRAFT_843541 [Suillus occidentalis]